jgi:ribosomal protein S18
MERSYFNGSHVVIPFKKEVFTKNETNTNIKFTNPEIHKKLQYYIKYGYMFTIINDIEHIDYKNVSHIKSQFITDLLAYKFK